MDWSRIGRLWTFPRRNTSSRSRWEYIGRDRADAFRMMDGSTCEDDLRRRGSRMALSFSRALDIRPQHRVLEVGCGVARIGREMASLCGTYVGADISRSLLGLARSRTSHLGNVSWVHLEKSGLAQVGAEHFDRLICHLVFLHLEEGEIADLLAGFRRVLRLGGVAYFDVWNLRHADVWDLFRRESLDSRVRTQPHRSRFYTRESMEEWVEAAGLVPLWVSDDSFLVQAVVARADADPSLHADLIRCLASEGKGLVPQGRLEFDAADMAASASGPPDHADT